MAGSSVAENRLNVQLDLDEAPTAPGHLDLPAG
jgi:hypothetical protein